MTTLRLPRAGYFLGATSSLFLAVLLVLPSGCKSASTSSSSDSSSSGSGNSSSSGASANNSKPSGKSGGGVGAELTEPVDSTTGKATGDSDDGNPSAVAHTSNAMPAAPEGTLNGKQQDKKLDSPESQNAPRVNAPPSSQ